MLQTACIYVESEEDNEDIRVFRNDDNISGSLTLMSYMCYRRCDEDSLCVVNGVHCNPMCKLQDLF